MNIDIWRTLPWYIKIIIWFPPFDAVRLSTLEESWQFYFFSPIWECLLVFCKNGSAHSSSPQTHKVGDDGLLSRGRTRQQEELNAFGSRCQLSMASWESGHCRQGLCSNHCPVLPVRHRRKPLSLPNNSSSHSPSFSFPFPPSPSSLLLPPPFAPPPPLCFSPSLSVSDA